MRSSSKLVAFLGVMSAVIFVVLLFETQVFAAILTISPCFLSLPIAVSLCIYGDWKKMFIGGTVLGVCSFIMSFMFPQFIVFANPLISVVPRVLFGIAAYGICKFVKYLFKSSNSCFLKEILPDSIAGITGAIVNTVLVVLALFIFNFTGLEDVLAMIISFNSLFEIISCAVFVPIITRTIRKYYKTNLSQENNNGDDK